MLRATEVFFSGFRNRLSSKRGQNVKKTTGSNHHTSVLVQELSDSSCQTFSKPVEERERHLWACILDDCLDLCSNGQSGTSIICHSYDCSLRLAAAAVVTTCFWQRFPRHDENNLRCRWAYCLPGRLISSDAHMHSVSLWIAATWARF